MHALHSAWYEEPYGIHYCCKHPILAWCFCLCLNAHLTVGVTLQLQCSKMGEGGHVGRKGNVACLEREAGQVWEVWQHREQGCIRAVAHL